MITAIVFVSAAVDRITEVAEKIAALPGVSEVYSVTGEIDLIALVRVRSHEEIAAVANYVTGRFGAQASALTAAEVERMREMQ